MYNLKSRREAAGFSQSPLAEASGIPIRMIRAYEAESPSAHKDINRAEALGYTYITTPQCDDELSAPYIREFLEDHGGVKR